MKLMTCPLNGTRNIAEFVYGGDVKKAPDPSRCTDRDWAGYLFMEENKKGIVKEWWMHVPSSYWFIAERDSENDEIIRTYPASDIFQERVNFDDP